MRPQRLPLLFAAAVAVGSLPNESRAVTWCNDALLIGQQSLAVAAAASANDLTKTMTAMGNVIPFIDSNLAFKDKLPADLADLYGRMDAVFDSSRFTNITAGEIFPLVDELSDLGSASCEGLDFASLKSQDDANVYPARPYTCTELSARIAGFYDAQRAIQNNDRLAVPDGLQKAQGNIARSLEKDMSASGWTSTSILAVTELSSQVVSAFNAKEDEVGDIVRAMVPNVEAIEAEHGQLCN